MKKFLAILMCIALCMSMFAACGGGGSSDNGGTTDVTGNDEGDATVDTTVYKIRYAVDETNDTPTSLAALRFKELIEERSGGRLQMEIFYDSAMGDEREISESVNMGVLEMGLVSACYIAPYAADWYLLDLPYVFLDRPTMYSYLDGAVGEHLKKVCLEKSNMEALVFADGSCPWKCKRTKKKRAKSTEWMMVRRMRPFGYFIKTENLKTPFIHDIL